MADQPNAPMAAIRSAVQAPLAVTAVLSTAVYAAMVAADRATGTLRADTTPITLWLLGAAFLLFAVSVWRTEQAAAVSWRWLWFAPVVFRLLLVATEPTLSDDVYRYLWDGNVFYIGL